jgi:G3E family GTPase
MIDLPIISPVPVNIICGALGAGKTTAIAKLLSSKPADEVWVVILNEFTDTGMDTLTLATAACGRFDVRTIPGGCLCCTGEEDFRRQLTSLLNDELPPSRILIEPSGIGHPGSVIQELQLFERSGSIKLMSSIAMIEPTQMQTIDALPEIARDQIESSDVILMSKAELADRQLRDRFEAWADTLFPVKRFIGFSEAGAIPLNALEPDDAVFRLTPIARRHSQRHIHDAAVAARDVSLQEKKVVAHVHRYLDREGCGWIIPDSVMFDLEKIKQSMSDPQKFVGVERFKAALRTGIDRWHLIQRWSNQFELREIAWRNDSRIEVQAKEGAGVEWNQWDEWLRVMVDQT